MAWCKSCCVTAKTKCDSDVSVEGRKITHVEMYSDDSNEDLMEDENVSLLMPDESPSKASSLFEKYKTSSKTVFDVRNFKSTLDDKNLQNDADFVVKAINDSHESLCKLVSE
jgi:hypothetical protein